LINNRKLFFSNEISREFEKDEKSGKNANVPSFLRLRVWNSGWTSAGAQEEAGDVVVLAGMTHESVHSR
jgi:hypothetical protein